MKTLLIIAFTLLMTTYSWGATFTWNANTESDLAGYRLYACPGTVTCTGGTKVGSDIPSTSTSLVITDPSVTTSYSLSAFDTSGNESGRSNTVTKVIADTTPPSAPQNLQLSSVVANCAPFGPCTDAMNVVWEVKPPAVDSLLLRNGVSIAQHVQRICLLNGVCQIETTDGQWWTYNGTTWNAGVAC